VIRSFTEKIQANTEEDEDDAKMQIGQCQTKLIFFPNSSYKPLHYYSQLKKLWNKLLASIKYWIWIHSWKEFF